NQSYTDTVLSYQNSRQPLNTTDKIRSNQSLLWSLFFDFNPKMWGIFNALCEQQTCNMLMNANLAKWSKNKVSNTGFEVADPIDSTLPKNWGRFQSTASTAHLSTSDPAIGNTSALITTTSTWQVLHQYIDE